MKQAQLQLSSYLKLGEQGGTGTGKSTTAALVLLGCSIAYHNKAAVHVFDTEPGWQFLKPIFDVEGVPLVIRTGRSFKGMHDALREAISARACGFAIDSLTHPWGELLERFADSTGRVPFHKFNQIKPLWNDWTADFLNAPLHCVACGRLTWEYFYEPAEDGRLDLVKGDSKMKAGGGESFGYEPHITCELRHQRKQINSGRLGGMEYHCLVLKDRSRVLNGKEFVFDDLGQYKPGDYRVVFEAFQPHIENLRGITGAVLPKDTSKEIIPAGDTKFRQEQQRKEVVLGELKETFTLFWPGQDAKTKRIRILVADQLMRCKSWAAVEAQPLDKLESALRVMQHLERSMKTDPPETEEGLLSLVVNAQQEAGQQEPVEVF